MVGSALSKFGEGRGMRKDSGMIFGWLYGYMVSMDEGSGFKDMLISAHMDEVARREFLDMVKSQPVSSEYRIMQSEYQDGRLAIRFKDKRGTLELMERFVDEYLPKLNANGLYCPVCGEDVQQNDCRQVLFEKMVQPMHTGCMDKLAAELREQELQQEREHNDTPPNIGRGTIGALVGALVGAIPWIIALCLDHYLSLLGFVIGICAKKGYEIMGGRKGKAKIIIVLVCTLLAVVVAQLVGTTIILSIDLDTPPFDTAWFIIQILAYDSEAASTFFSDMLPGVLFAVLGFAGVFMGMRKESKKHKASEQYKDMTAL